MHELIEGPIVGTAYKDSTKKSPKFDHGEGTMDLQNSLQSSGLRGLESKLDSHEKKQFQGLVQGQHSTIRYEKDGEGSNAVKERDFLKEQPTVAVRLSSQDESYIDLK